jgi:phosphoenolpyruvate carboxylase
LIREVNLDIGDDNDANPNVNADALDVTLQKQAADATEKSRSVAAVRQS